MKIFLHQTSIVTDKKKGNIEVKVGHRKEKLPGTIEIKFAFGIQI